MRLLRALGTHSRVALYAVLFAVGIWVLLTGLMIENRHDCVMRGHDLRLEVAP